jgi:hypothetical protein
MCQSYDAAYASRRLLCLEEHLCLEERSSGKVPFPGFRRRPTQARTTFFKHGPSVLAVETSAGSVFRCEHSHCVSCVNALHLWGGPACPAPNGPTTSHTSLVPVRIKREK